jgi:IS605 OrfB family transposase
LPEEQWEEKECPLCKAKKKKLNHALDGYRTVGTGDDALLVVDETETMKVCNCFKGACAPNHRVMRKFVMPSKNRSINPELDFTVFGRLSPDKLIAGQGSRPSIYDSCLQKAMEAIKSQIKIKEKIDSKCKFFERRLKENEDFLAGTADNKRLEEYSIKVIKGFVVADKRRIEKLKNRKADKIEYKQNAIRLYADSYNIVKKENDFIIELKDYASPKDILKIKFLGDNYQKKLAEKFVDAKKAETEIIRTSKGYFLQYIYRQENKVPIPDETFTAVGIDVGILNSACHVCMDKSLKPFNIKLFNGRPLRRRLRQFDKIRRIWQMRKRMRKVKEGKGREMHYIKYYTHYLTTKIILDIKDKIEKPVIVFENLTDINDEIDKRIESRKKVLKELKGSKKKYYIALRRLNLEFKKWNFADFQKFMEYKANWLGVPVMYVPAKNTTITCNKCGHLNKEYSDNGLNLHRLDLKCSNCGYQINADFNAAVNIAKSYFSEDNLKLLKELIEKEKEGKAKINN